MTYEELLTLSDSENLIVKEKEIPGYGGRIYKNRIAINRTLPTQAEKSCVLAEELDITTLLPEIFWIRRTS